MPTGKMVRQFRLFNSKTHTTVMAPVDDILLSGPEMGLRDVGKTLDLIAAGRPNAILGFSGMFGHHIQNIKGVSGIMNVTASTIRSSHTRKVLVGTVEQAVALGMDGVAVHVNVTSKYEPEMMQNLASISRDCDRFGMPLLALMYPRGEKSNGSDENYREIAEHDREQYAELVRHAVRIGVELGADMIKTQFTGDVETFRSVVECASGVPIIMAGGAKVTNENILSNCAMAMEAGAAGVCIGRNIFNHENPTAVVKALNLVVHERKSVKEAINVSGLAKEPALAL